ncbi:hypothetical protein [Deinococcus sp.]|uniref:hypothetical protein n=1 Tax=Deinococcus sp. TaxID=47478 RepID=UPI003C7B5C83
MTFPSPQMPPAYGMGAKPQKLSWVTVPLIIQMILGALGVIFLPFLIPLINLAASDPSSLQNSGTSPAEVRAVLAFFAAFIWVFEIISVAFLVLYFLAFRAVQQGKNWGRIVAIVVFILGLLSFPLGTAIGIFGLIGAFDAEVTAYCNR